MDFSLKIPSDCLAIVCSYLPMSSIQNLSLVNKTLNSSICCVFALCKVCLELNESVWQYLCNVQFHATTNEANSWKQMYKLLNKKTLNPEFLEVEVKIDGADFKFVS